jgi:hypothetical protein
MIEEAMVSAAWRDQKTRAFAPECQRNVMRWHGIESKW